MSKLIFGCGYLGVRVTQLWRDAGEDVTIVTRSADRAEEFQAAGYEALVADVARPETLDNLPAAETVLFAVGFDRSSNHTIHEVYADGVKNVRAALPSSVERFIYISTTGVYGPAAGAWVDESTLPNPQREGGRASLAAEQQLDGKSISLRLAGIYGPNRIPYLDKLRVGEPIAAPSEGWLNLIHVDDAAAIVVATDKWAAENGVAEDGAHHQSESPYVLCVSDGQPVVRGDYYREVARRIGAAPPRFVEPDPASPAAARARSDKRIANKKLQQQLNYCFKYPSYREGLAVTL